MIDADRPPEETGADPDAAVEPLPASDPEAAVEPLPAADPVAAVEPLPAADPTPATEPTAIAAPPAAYAPPEAYAPPAGADAGQASAWPEEHVPDGYAERPHLYVAGAFAGGFLVAKLLGKLGRG